METWFNHPGFHKLHGGYLFSKKNHLRNVQRLMMVETPKRNQISLFVQTIKHNDIGHLHPHAIQANILFFHHFSIRAADLFPSPFNPVVIFQVLRLFRRTNIPSCDFSTLDSTLHETPRRIGLHSIAVQVHSQERVTKTATLENLLRDPTSHPHRCSPLHGHQPTSPLPVSKVFWD